MALRRAKLPPRFVGGLLGCGLPPRRDARWAKVMVVATAGVEDVAEATMTDGDTCLSGSS